MIARLKGAAPARQFGMLLLGLAGVVIIIGGLDQYPNLHIFRFLQRLFADLYANVGAELASIAITVLIIDRLNQRRADEQQKAALILKMGSPDHSFAIEAVRMLNARGWLVGDTLKKAHLSHANLEGANLQRVNLEDARLPLAMLRKAKLTDANLHHAYLQGCDLENANLCGTNLQGANLNDTNLFGVRMDINTLFDSNTILPDCTYWSPGTDMSRFADPEHSEFWRSHNPNSPACQYHYLNSG